MTATDQALDPAPRRINLAAMSSALSLVVIIAAFWAFFSWRQPGFLSSFNLLTLGRALAIDIVIGFAQMVVLATGVVPIHDDGTVTLVGQYRFPLKQYSWEIPEGGGRKGVEPQESAARELREETGLTARRWMPLMKLHLSNCITDEVAYTFVAWGLEQGESAPDETEVLAVRRVPFAEVIDLVMDGAITDAMAVASLLKLRVLAAEDALPEDLAAILRL